MSGSNDHSGDCGGNAAPYVLGALTEAEHEAFLAHLSTCAVCREEVAALQMVAAALPAAAPQVPAPAKLKRRVMSEVRADARRAAAERSRPPAARRALGPRRWRLAIVPATAALAVIALVTTLALSGGSGTRVIRAEVSAPGASAAVRVSGSHAELTLAGMPQTAPGRVYELWVKRSRGPEPTDALFTVTAHGQATVGVPGSVAGVKALMVTSEPLGGSRAPTTAPSVVATLG